MNFQRLLSIFLRRAVSYSHLGVVDSSSSPPIRANHIDPRHLPRQHQTTMYTRIHAMYVFTYTSTSMHIQTCIYLSIHTYIGGKWKRRIRFGLPLSIHNQVCPRLPSPPPPTPTPISILRRTVIPVYQLFWMGHV